MAEPKPPQERDLRDEEAKAVPAESVRSERKSAGSRITLSHIFIKNDVSEDSPHLLKKG